MANSTSTPYLWVLDTVGFLQTGSIHVRKVVMIPNAANDAVTFKTWNENSADEIAAGVKYLKTGTITNTNTLTSTGNLPSGILDGSIFRITASTGAAANIGRHLVETAGTTNAVVIHGDDWTNEATKIYSWKTYTTVEAIYLKAGATDASPVQLDFGAMGRRFINLGLDAISASAKVYVYLVGSEGLAD
jgi:hypothetical protein